jgi:hypothetical protein
MGRHGEGAEPGGFSQAVQSALFFESAPELFERVFRELKPRAALPRFEIEFRQFANADSFVRLENGRIHARISDLFEGAPAPVLEALAHILLAKLFRRAVARAHATRYRLYLNRKDVRRQAHLIRQIRGRKFISGPQGEVRDLERIFERLNREFFDGLLGRPQLGWSRRPSRSLLGHFDPSHNAIIISRIFDQEDVPEEALAYVLFHEMLHLRYPVEHNGSHRRVHTREFREAEKKYPQVKQAKELLKRL